MTREEQDEAINTAWRRIAIAFICTVITITAMLLYAMEHLQK